MFWHTHGVFAHVVTELSLASGGSRSLPVTAESLRCVSEEQFGHGTAARLEPDRY